MFKNNNLHDEEENAIYRLELHDNLCWSSDSDMEDSQNHKHHNNITNPSSSYSKPVSQVVTSCTTSLEGGGSINECHSAVNAMMNDSRMDIFMNNNKLVDEENDDQVAIKKKPAKLGSSEKTNDDLNTNSRLVYPPPVYDSNLPSCRVHFSTLCKYFEKLSENSKHKEKKAILDKIFSSCRDDLFQFMRLLLPQLDRERLTYGLKESKIAKCYIEILGLF